MDRQLPRTASVSPFISIKKLSSFLTKLNEAIINIFDLIVYVTFCRLFIKRKLNFSTHHNFFLISSWVFFSTLQTISLDFSKLESKFFL
ncbi:hypothetical protein T484DRAFT_1989995 [Baffinella frigidus]|nr:hypothetical protein T484DRAFT_1989995 [Cryptophyta sp. CCMP2293]